MNLKDVFPGKPSRKFYLRLDDIPGYQEPDYKKIPQEASSLVSYIFNSIRPDARGQSKGLLVSLSGGIDSSTTAMLAKTAIEDYGRGTRLFCATIKLDHTNEMEAEDIEFANRFCRDFDIEQAHIDAEPLLEAWKRKQPADPESNPASYVHRLARLRGLIASQEAVNRDLLVVGTMNKSEDVLRAFTEGQMSSHLGFLNQLYKAEVFKLAETIGIPDYIMEKEPGGSELRMNEVEQFGARHEEGLDAVLYLMHEIKKSPEQIHEEFGIDIDWLNRVDRQCNGQEWRVNTHGFVRESLVGH